MIHRLGVLKHWQLHRQIVIQLEVDIPLKSVWLGIHVDSYLLLLLNKSRLNFCENLQMPV